MQERNGLDEELRAEREQKVRDMVDEMWATPEGREGLRWFFTMPADEFEYCVRQLDRDLHPPNGRKSEEEIARIVAAHVRRLESGEWSA